MSCLAGTTHCVWMCVCVHRSGTGAGSTYRGDTGRSTVLPERKLLEVQRRGSSMTGQYATTRRNVFGGDGEVWLGVGSLMSNAVWVAPSKDHVVVSVSEGGAVMWGKNVDGCMGPIEETLKQDPDLYESPVVRAPYPSHITYTSHAVCVSVRHHTLPLLPPCAVDPVAVTGLCDARLLLQVPQLCGDKQR